MTYERNKIFDQIQVITTKNWPYICDHLDRILITGGSESGKTNELLNLIKHKGLDITKIIYTSEIHLNQSINCLRMEENK